VPAQIAGAVAASSRVPGGNRVARRQPAYPDGSFRAQIESSVSVVEVRALVAECEKSGASLKSFRKVCEAAENRINLLETMRVAIP
jgi:hypothetical protein